MIQLKEEEKQVLTLCSQGLTMNEIADNYYIESYSDG